MQQGNCNTKIEIESVCINLIILYDAACSFLPESVIVIAVMATANFIHFTLLMAGKVILINTVHVNVQLLGFKDWRNPSLMQLWGPDAGED